MMNHGQPPSATQRFQPQMVACDERGDLEQTWWLDAANFKQQKHTL